MSPRRVEANEEIKAKQRERILDAAAQVFARRGLSAARIADIASRAEVSHGLVHHYFGTKVGVYSALIERTMQNATVVPRMALEQPGSPLDQFRWLTSIMLAGVAAYPEAFFLSAEASANETVPEELRRLVGERGLQARAVVAELIARGQARAELRAGDATTLSAFFFALTQGIALQRLGDGADAPVPDAEQIVGLFRA